MTLFRLHLMILVVFSSLAGAQIKVAVLHPLLGDLVGKIGGERVEVVDLMGNGGDPHTFEPGATELRQAQGSNLSVGRVWNHIFRNCGMLLVIKGSSR